ncbi:Cytochrome P450 [Sphingomonas laterariae]|uniref:Cytochrome P450 n=1 Tax=Edaphosphingomonas laterariae TaxID=861865 RepID=A0A239C734_9SPHN|nr:cytochrome P450 [Sphingomonas laterariae]SNS16046.1 Cytochrome P450 [Sphingomonas laterariae]
MIVRPDDYDPYSHAAMADPEPFYAALRETGAPHYLPQYDAWAITCFDDVTRASLRAHALDFTRGQTPGQVLLGEPVPATFMTLNQEAHRRWRNVLAPYYTPAGVAAEEARLTELSRSILAPLLAQGRMDVFGDFANRVMVFNAGYNLGFPEQDAIWVRERIDDMMHREPGQVGMVSARNQEAAGALFGYLHQFVGGLRAEPGRALRHTKALIEAEVDGQRLSDEEMVSNLFSLLVTGSETTPMAVAGTIYYLARHPDQKRRVLADPGLAGAAFRETLRFDQPTNMLARYVHSDFELGGRQIRAGQRLLLIYAAANRDETRFERAHDYDLGRYAGNGAIVRDASFGAGAHFCLGMHLALTAGTIMVRQLLEAVGDFELIEAGCRRAYGEFLAGFTQVPIQFQPIDGGRGQ